MKVNLDVLGPADKHLLDLASVSAVWLAFFEALPEIALLITILWTLIRIWETETVRKLFGRDKKDISDG